MPKRPRNFSVRPFDVDSAEDRYFTACARLRNITPHALARRLLVLIANDQMINAVLDDADHLQQKKRNEKRFRGEKPVMAVKGPRYGSADYPL